MEDSSAAAALPSSSAAVSARDRARAALGRLDAALLGILGLVVIAQVSWWHGATAGMLHEYYFHDVYFNADLSQRYENLVVPGSNLFRIRLHPLYPLLAMSWTRGLVGLGLSPAAVVRGYVTLVALVWVGLGLPPGGRGQPDADHRRPGPPPGGRAREPAPPCRARARAAGGPLTSGSDRRRPQPREPGAAGDGAVMQNIPMAGRHRGRRKGRQGCGRRRVGSNDTHETYKHRGCRQ